MRLLHEIVAERFGDQLDQRLLARHVVVQRRDIDADAIGNVAGAEALDALFDDQGPGRPGDGVAAVVGGAREWEEWPRSWRPA